MTAKTARISAGPEASAKPKAVPSSGAVQGVASSVASTPAPKLPSKASLRSPSAATNPGNGIW